MGNDQIPKKERGYITKQINSHTSNKTGNMVWTDSQDHGEDEILHTSKTMLFHKTTRFISEIPTLFRVPPQLFHPSYSIFSVRSKANNLERNPGFRVPGGAM